MPGLELSDTREDRERPAWLYVLLLAYVVGLSALPGKELAVFSGDAGVKFLQVEALDRGSAELAHPAPDLDPANRLFPLRAPYVIGEAEAPVSIYLNPVVLLAVPLHRLGGPRSVRAALALCIALTVLLCVPVARRLGLSPRASQLAAVATLLATPAWFYGGVFWEHAPAVLLTTAGTLALLGERGADPRLRLVGAGALLGIAASCRPEAMLYLTSLALAFALVERAARPALVLASAGIATYLGVSLAIPGLPLEEMLASIARRIQDASFAAADPRTGFPGGRLGLARALVGGVMDPSGADLRWLTGSILGACLLLLALGFDRRLARGRLRWGATLLGGGLVVWAIPPALRDERTLLSGLLTACPLFALALPALTAPLPDLGARPASAEPLQRSRSLVGLASLLFLVATVLLAQDSGGNQWGPRLLLPLFPFLVCLGLHAAQETDRTRLAHAALVLLLVLSLGIQVLGLRNHIAVTRSKARGLADIAAMPGRVVLAFDWFVPQEASLLSLELGKQLLLAPGPGDAAYAFAQLARSPESAFVLVESARIPLTGRSFGPFRMGERIELDLPPFRMRAISLVRRGPPVDGP